MALNVNVGKILVKLFGSRNDRLLKRYWKLVDQVNAQEEKIRLMSDEQLRARTLELHLGLVGDPGTGAKPSLRSEDVRAEALAILREAMDRNIGIRQIFNPEEDEMGVRFDPARLTPEGRQLFEQVQQQLIASGQPWQTVPIPVGLYDAVREAYPESRPPFRARPFDVQVIGGIVLYEGRIAEMATGEGKTFVAPLACFLRVLEGYHCHVVTVNDYLVRRDATWIMPAFNALGLSVGYIQSDMDPGGDERRRMYECDVTYGTNSEFGFDYLRDNMKTSKDQQVQGPLDFAIVDEVDSILIDEARTPLIISGAAHDDAPKYVAAAKVAKRIIDLNRPWTAVEKQVDAAQRAIKAAEGDLEKANDKAEKDAANKRREKAQADLAEAETKKEGLTQYYEIEWDRKSAHLTHEGIAAAQEAAGVGSFYVGNNVEWPHLMEQAMRAHVVYERDKDYVVERNPRTGEQEVIIIDEYTGRKMVGRQWSDGLHQSVEAKEAVKIKEETQTLATITLQNFFKLYRALSGMTGTAQTEAEEFTKIYSLEVVTIPTNRPVVRLYQDETNLVCTLCVDASGSMRFNGHRGAGVKSAASPPGSKLEYAQYLATGMSHVIAGQQDQVGLAVIGRGLRDVMPPGGTGGHLLRLHAAVEQLQTDPATDLAVGLRDLFGRLPRRGVLLVTSDFLVDDLEPVVAALRLFRHRRWEVVCLHLIHPDEERLPDGPAFRFEGLENDGRCDCSPSDLRRAYQDRFEAHCTAVRTSCLAAGCDYRRVSTATPYLQTLSTFLVDRSG